MEKLRKVADSVENFIEKHKVGIAVTVTATACLALNRYALREHDAFLKEKGLYDEYYTPEDEELEE